MDGSNKRSRDEFDQGSNEYDDPAKKQHIDPMAELTANICKDIRRIGENSNLVNQVEDISYITNPIVAEFEKVDSLREAILRTLYAVVKEQPHKIPNVSILVLICNAKNFLVSKIVVEYFHARAQELLDKIRAQDVEMEDSNTQPAEPVSDRTDGEGEELVAEMPEPSENAGVFNDLKSILKFLATLAPIIDNNAVGTVLKQFLQTAIDLQEASSTRCGVAEALYYNVLLATPYLFANELSDLTISQANEIVELSQKFSIREQENSIAILEPFDTKGPNFVNELPYQPQKIINLIGPAILSLQTDAKDWSGLKSSLFLEFSDLVGSIIKESLGSNSISNEIIKHSLPQFSIPPTEELLKYKPDGLIDRLWFEHPRLIFQVYNSATSFETVPSIHSYLGLFFKDLAFDILTNMSFNQKEASIQLSILDLFCSKNLFSPPGSTVDQLALIAKDNESGENVPPLSTWKVEDVAVESILTMIFQLPKSLHHQIYYYTVLISCCRESPVSIAPVFGRAIRFLYKHLETLDYELKIRFMDWMTTQISNFDFSWKWDEWVADSKKYANLTYHPKKNFIKNLIAKEIRLSNKARIKDSFVTMSEDSNGESSVMALDEFFKYLDISLFPSATQYIINYDYELYGGDNDDLRETVETSIQQRVGDLASKMMVSAQEELLFEFSNPKLPLSEIANKLYDFIIANWRSNEQFSAMVNETIDAIKSSVVNAQTDKVLVNLIFQTYAYIGSRSIYSVVSIINRDIAKLKHISGVEISEEDYKVSGTDFKFPEWNLTPEEFENRQLWVVDSILRIWIHQPQVAFLILEYLIEFDILESRFLIHRALGIENNLIINNVSCMESINRVLSASAKVDEKFKPVILLLFGLIVNNLNTVLERLALLDPANEDVRITTDFSDEEASDLEFMGNIDNQWLFYEYRGLLKTYLRQFYQQLVPMMDDVRVELTKILNKPLERDTLSWIEELSR